MKMVGKHVVSYHEFYLREIRRTTKLLDAKNKKQEYVELGSHPHFVCVGCEALKHLMPNLIVPIKLQLVWILCPLIFGRKLSQIPCC